MTSFFALAAVMQTLGAPAMSAEAPAPIAIRAARLLDVRSGAYLDKPVVVVRGDVIESVGKEVPAGARVIELGERVILPGLIDAHTHILMQGDATQADYDDQLLKEYPAHRVARAIRSLKIALDHGFTTLRDMETEGASYDDVALRDAVKERVIPGPRIFAVGPGLSSTGSYPLLHYRPDWKVPSGVGLCDGADACRKAVREQLSYGTDWLKVYLNMGGRRLTHDGYFDSPPTFSREEVDALVTEAHAKGVKVAAHATSDTAVRLAVAAGVDSIEHGDSIRPERAREMAAKGIFLVPTFTAIAHVVEIRAKQGGGIWQDVSKVKDKSFANCRKAGVRIALGTDAGAFPWTELNQARELEHEVAHGMTPLEAIRSATTTAADLLGFTGKMGVIEKGAFADLVAVSGDPLKDVSVLSKIDFVMKAGEVARPLP